MESQFKTSLIRTRKDSILSRRVRVSLRIKPKGGTLEQFPALGGKSQGKSGSTNKPKEPTPLTRQGETEAPGKPKEAVVVTKTKPQGPPIKAG